MTSYSPQGDAESRRVGEQGALDVIAGRSLARSASIWRTGNQGRGKHFPSPRPPGDSRTSPPLTKKSLTVSFCLRQGGPGIPPSPPHLLFDPPLGPPHPSASLRGASQGGASGGPLALPPAPPLQLVILPGRPDGTSGEARLHEGLNFSWQVSSTRAAGTGFRPSLAQHPELQTLSLCPTGLAPNDSFLGALGRWLTSLSGGHGEGDYCPLPSSPQNPRHPSPDREASRSDA